MDKFHGTTEENHPGEFLGDVLTLVPLGPRRKDLLMSKPFQFTIESKCNVQLLDYMYVIK